MQTKEKHFGGVGVGDCCECKQRRNILGVGGWGIAVSANKGEKFGGWGLGGLL